tara:strand:+ start:353 stop:1051 length:699 start_codon:yes stop_codon:yes gene_type:complete
MGYLNNQVVTVDAILTKKGRELMAKGDGSFKIEQFALSDDEVDYTLYNPNHPSGSAYYGEAIENMPLLEAFPDETQMMKYKLVSLARGTALMPTLQLSAQSLTIKNGAQFDLRASTINYLAGQSQEPSGYQFTISDIRVFGTFVGNGLEDTQAAEMQNQANAAQVITNGTSTSQTVIGFSCSGTATSVPTLFSQTSALYATLTVIGLDSGARAQVPITINNASITTLSAGVS